MLRKAQAPGEDLQTEDAPKDDDVKVEDVGDA